MNTDSASPITTFLKEANTIGVWDILTLMIGLAGAITAWLILRTRRHDRFSLHPSYRINTGHSLYPNVIHFIARNLADAPVVICRPNFKASHHLKISDTAHGNLETGDYELKFRMLNPDYSVVPGFSYTTIMLRHRESAMAYIPIDPSYSAADIAQAITSKKPLGWITFDIITVGDQKPRVVRLKQRLHRMAQEQYPLELGRDPASQGST